MERFSMDKAELYVSSFLSSYSNKSTIELCNSLMYMEYLLDEVRSRVSHSEIELLLVEGIDRCKDLLEEKS